MCTEDTTTPLTISQLSMAIGDLHSPTKKGDKSYGFTPPLPYPDSATPPNGTAAKIVDICIPFVAEESSDGTGELVWVRTGPMSTSEISDYRQGTALRDTITYKSKPKAECVSAVVLSEADEGGATRVRVEVRIFTSSASLTGSEPSKGQHC